MSAEPNKPTTTSTNNNNPQEIEHELYDEEAKKAIHAVFKKFDKDGSGDIQYDEITALAQELGITIKHEEVLQIFRDLDINGDKKISFEEFWAWWSSGSPNRLERLVYFKLKSMQLLKRAHVEFSRMGESLQGKFDEQVDTHYIALNYGTSKGECSINFEAHLKAEKSKAIRAEAFRNSQNIDADAAFGVVIRMKVTQNSQKNSVREIKKTLKRLLMDAKRVFGLLNGPQMSKLIEPFEFEFFESDNEVVLFVDFKKSTLEKLYKNEVVKNLKKPGEKSNASFEMHLGVKNSLKKALAEENLGFIDWLLEGFLVETKLEMNSGLLKNIRRLLIAFIAQKQGAGQEAINKITLVSLVSLLRSSKVHLTFKDMDNVKQFLESMGLAELNEKSPKFLDLLKEILEDCNLHHLIAENSPYPILKNLLLFLAKNIDGSDFKIYFLIDFIVAKVNLSLPGLGELIEKLIVTNSKQ